MLAGVYKHYKGGYYQVLGVAEHTETKEQMAVYVSLSGIDMPGPRMRVRPLIGPDGWYTAVHTDTGGVIARFTYIGTEIPVTMKRKL